ncbi:hypothetical protein GC177_00585 [bacterium]|nr:hypothetical protein [bacterium]
MTDGPFRNLKLSRRWKRFSEAVQNDSVDKAEVCALASDAFVREILTDDAQALMADLQAYEQREQLDFDPTSSFEAIFDDHSKTPFADTLQKELAFRLAEKMPPNVAVEQALEASVNDQIIEARNHIEEECIRVLESGEMRKDQFDRTITQVDAAFETLNKDAICDAIRAGDKNAFKNAVSKKKGLDEGPNL